MSAIFRRRVSLVSLEEMSSATGNAGGLTDETRKRFCVALEVESSRCVSAVGGLFGIQMGALETFDAFLCQVLICVTRHVVRP